jgi:hypothetical protein
MKLFFLRKEIYHAAGCCEAKAMNFIYLNVLCAVVDLFLQAICVVKVSV